MRTGTVGVKDVTAVLARQGYWPSYNVPYLPDIYSKSGLPASGINTYANASRALIFARDAPRLLDIAGFKRLLRYNDFRHDEVCTGERQGGYCAVSARGDLNSGDGAFPFGGVDSKVTAASMINASSVATAGGWRRVAGSGEPSENGAVDVDAACGPSHDQESVFAWGCGKACDSVSRLGVPDSFPFEYVRISSDD
jgi:hypothetical protein